VNSPWTFALRSSAITTAAFVLLSTGSLAQEGASAPPSQAGDASVRELDSQVRELRTLIEQMRAENAQSRAEMQELRQELQDTRKLLAPVVASMNNTALAAEATPLGQASPTSPQTAAPASSGTSTAADLGSRVQKLEESNQLLGSKIDEQYQTKVETAGK